MRELIAGIDEAGRGPVLGPMGLSITACDAATKQELSDTGIKDSKTLTAKHRHDYASRIRASCIHATRQITPHIIDTALFDPSSSLTMLEALESARLITRLSKKLESDDTLTKIIIDLPSRNRERYLASLRKHLPKNLRSIELVAEHKADQNHVEVSAASILAKVARDNAIRSFEKKHDLKLGSGYPSDPFTRDAISSYYETLVKHSFIRESWAPARKVSLKKAQSSLKQY